MNIFGFKPKGDVWTGVAIAAAVLAAPVVIPVVAAAVRPLIKAGIKGGYIIFDKGREVVEGAKEMCQDLAAEARAELNAGSEADID